MRTIFTLSLLLFISLLLPSKYGTGTLSAQNIGDTQVGVASFYADAFDGDRTAYGATYRKGELVAAHSLYPFNSMVRVTNIANGNTTTVRIIDQGPWIEGRIIEVSRRAAEVLGFVDEGTARVTLTLLSTPDQPATTTTSKPTVVDSDKPSTRSSSTPPRNTTPAPTPYQSRQEPRRNDQQTAEESAQKARVVSTPTPAPQERATQQEASPEKKSQVVDPPVTFSADKDTPPFMTNGQFGDGLFKIEIREAGEGDYGVQVAALGDLQSAMEYVATLQAKWFTNILIRKTGTMYKVILGPFTSHKEASIYAKDLKRKYKINGFTVEL